MAKQTTSTILMVRPAAFGYNEETATNNYYQKVLEGIEPEEVQERALAEFDSFVRVLRNAGVEVIVVEDQESPYTPDAVFPNNWISFHNDGSVGLYPMFAKARRLERRQDVIEEILPGAGFEVGVITDFSQAEVQSKFLEGTGSIVLDRENSIAYASLSLRTDRDLLDDFAGSFNYKLVVFTSYQDVVGRREPIYHTNVMMCVADKFAILCADAIDDPKERQAVINSLESTHKEVINITEDQKHHFAGNMLQVENAESKKYLVMSSAAFNSLRSDQIEDIEKYNPILHSSLDTIEACGGGSARCMMAEVFLPRN